MKAILIALLMAAPLLAGEIPADLEKLVEARAKEINRINLAYAKRLDVMLADYRAKGDTAGIEATEKLIAEIEGGTAPKTTDAPPKMTSLIGKWRRDYDKNIFEFIDESNGIYAGTTPFTMTFNPESGMVTMTAEKWVDTVEFTLHADILRGGHENKVRYKLTRLK